MPWLCPIYTKHVNSTCSKKSFVLNQPTIERKLSRSGVKYRWIIMQEKFDLDNHPKRRHLYHEQFFKPFAPTRSAAASSSWCVFHILHLFISVFSLPCFWIRLFRWSLFFLIGLACTCQCLRMYVKFAFVIFTSSWWHTPCVERWLSVCIILIVSSGASQTTLWQCTLTCLFFLHFYDTNHILHATIIFCLGLLKSSLLLDVDTIRVFFWT